MPGFPRGGRFAPESFSASGFQGGKGCRAFRWAESSPGPWVLGAPGARTSWCSLDGARVRQARNRTAPLMCGPAACPSEPPASRRLRSAAQMSRGREPRGHGLSCPHFPVCQLSGVTSAEVMTPQNREESQGRAGSGGGPQARSPGVPAVCSWRRPGAPAWPWIGRRDGPSRRPSDFQEGRVCGRSGFPGLARHHVGAQQKRLG